MASHVTQGFSIGLRDKVRQRIASGLPVVFGGRNGRFLVVPPIADKVAGGVQKLRGSGIGRVTMDGFEEFTADKFTDVLEGLTRPGCVKPLRW